MTPQVGLLYQPGLVAYDRAWAWQQKLVEQRRTGSADLDVLMLLEHTPIYTLGQGATTAHLKFDPENFPIPVHRIERGGEVTYHCPGQLVGYPILNLHHYRQDLHWYLRQLEEVLIQAIAPFGLMGDRIPDLTGVWVEGRKIAAIGIKVSRWITMHGFALNVCPDLSGFQHIVPCGIGDRPVGSLAEFLPDISFQLVQEQVAIAFQQVFDLQLTPVETWADVLKE
jgi:lipoyl(octanoyl) transferase